MARFGSISLERRVVVQNRGMLIGQLRSSLPRPLPIASLRGSISTITMKPLAILLLLGAAAGADDLLPQSFAKDRYAKTLAKSPFILETKAAEPEAPKVNPFQNLYVRGVGKADGKDYVLIQRLGEERPMKPFIANEPHEDGLVVKTVRFGSNYRETKVVLEMGPDSGEVGFKEDTINTPPAAPNAGRGPAGMQGGMPKPGGPPMPMAMPQTTAVRLSMPIAPTNPIPRPGGTAVPMPMSKPPTSIPQPPAGMSTKSRSRPISN